MKNTKKTRRVAAFAAAVMMAACVAVPMSSFSASAAGSISIANDATGHTYEAYQIFDGSLSDGILSNIVWGSGIDSGKTSQLLTAIQGITLDTAIIVNKTIPNGTTTPFAAASDAAAVAKVLSDGYYANTEEATLATSFAHDAEITKKFAAVVGQYLSASPTGSVSTPSEGVYTISNVDDGYYLVKDKNGELAGDDDSYTRYIVQVLGNKTDIAPKSSKPSVIKKVKEDDKSVTGTVTVGAYTAAIGYNDVADYCIGEAVPFELIGTMPSTYDDYTSYYYQFTDTLATNFTLNTDSITVKVVNPDNNEDGNPEETTLTAATNYTVSSQHGTGKFTITINDTKSIAAITKESVIVVDYTATLNNTAEIGLPGQENKVDLTYSNNPNYTGTGAGTPSVLT